jgi:hypothetical protein
MLTVARASCVSIVLPENDATREGRAMVRHGIHSRQLGIQ